MTHSQTPQVSSDVSDLRRPTSSASSLSAASSDSDSTPPSLETPPTHSLDLTPCDKDTFINRLPAQIASRYELVEGLLARLQMPDGQHDGAVLAIIHKYRDEVAETLRAQACTSATPHAVPFAIPSPIVSISSTTHRVLDIAIGRACLESGKPAFGSGSPPSTIVEVSSNNRSTDLGPKVSEYLSIGVKNYYVTDRDMTSKRRIANSVFINSLCKGPTIITKNTRREIISPFLDSEHSKWMNCSTRLLRQSI